MTGVVLVSLLGILILVFGIALISQSAGRRKRASIGIENYANARRALDLVSVEAAVIRRIFSEEDLHFAVSSGQREFQKLFFQERKRLAIQCLRRTQRQIDEIVNLHLKLAGYAYAPSPRFELRLSTQHFNFLIVSQAVLLLLRLAGPFRTADMISYTIGSAERFCNVLNLKLDEIRGSRASFPVANLW